MLIFALLVQKHWHLCHIMSPLENFTAHSLERERLQLFNLVLLLIVLQKWFWPHGPLERILEPLTGPRTMC